MSNFALIGVGGYVAPRHLKAIKDTGNNLIAAYDKSDSVGIIDRFFPNASFFTEQELFDRHCSKIRETPDSINYLSVCTPNYLHDAHIRYGLRLGADVICEKPLVLNPWNVEALGQVERTTGRKINTILQLRLHPEIISLKKHVEKNASNKKYEVDLTYITSRGNWYYTSWKGDVRKSGGIATNIGVHLYDMLVWVFGNVKDNIVHVSTHDRIAGYLDLENARVRYFLSINKNHLPEDVQLSNKTTYRSMLVDGQRYEFSEGFEDLHTESYKKILKGEGFQLSDVLASIQLVHDIRNAVPVGLREGCHPMALLPKENHPFGWS